MNTYYIAGFPVSDELYHHGIIGQKWGIRRYQNEDGTLTAAGKARYGNANKAQENFKKIRDAYDKETKNEDNFYEMAEGKLGKRVGDDYKWLRDVDKFARDASGYSETYKEYEKARQKRANNINPFKAKKLYEALNEQSQKLKEASKRTTDLWSNMTMEVVNMYPKDLRDTAMAYAYIWAGYDW